jgi:hypothetical protein
VLIDSPHRDDNLLGVRPPGPSPGDAVSIKSSKDKRPKRSPGETLTSRVEVSAPAAQRGRTTLMVIFARREDFRRVEDGLVRLRRFGPPGSVAACTTGLRVRAS